MAGVTGRPQAGAARLGANYWKLWSASVASNFGDGLSAVAYPWLASAVTRSPVQIALIGVAQRLPWLLFTLPAGVITDRVDRRRLVASMDVIRLLITLAVAGFVLAYQARLPSVEEAAAGVTLAGSGPLLGVLYAASLAFGFAEVLRDNAAQTLMPSVVDESLLEKANGRLWGAEMIMNSFVGPPLAGLLLAVAFSLPFFIDAGTFAVAAALVFALTGTFTVRAAEQTRRSFRAEIAEGVRWLWSHQLLRPMAISLGATNALGSLATATFILFAQEVLDLSAAGFGALLAAFAVGGVIGSALADRVSKLIGPGRSLLATLVGSGVAYLVTGLTSSPVLAGAMGLLEGFLGVLWNVITVSLRQRLIPDHLLGRVNSVYRLLAWGSIPLGAALGGALVALVEGPLGRTAALRWPFFAATVGLGLTALYARARLTTEKIEAAKGRGIT